MTNKKFEVNPWEVKGDIDYGKLIKEFGIEPLKELPEIFENNVLFRRKTIFAHRDIGRVLMAIKNKKKFVMMTGLMPSGNFHLGHMLVVQQMIFYQKLGAKIYIAVADLEAYNARGSTLKEMRKIAIEQYIKNYIALGLSSKNCEIYFQSDRSKDSVKANAYYRLASNFSRYSTFNEFKAVYGDISPGKMNASLLQAADMFHAQLPEFEGSVPIIVPVGTDQDPHLRLARGMSKKFKEHKFIQLSSTYHLFLPGLGGGKMSSSDPNSHIAMTDSEKEVANKINKYAFSGGRATLEEHKKKGGNPDIDVSFQYLKMFFEENDNKLKQIEEDYRNGNLTTGELKKYTIDKINVFLKKHQEKRAKITKNDVENFLYK